MSSFVSQSNIAQPGNARLQKLEAEGKTNNSTLFRVVNLITGLETHVPGGAISRFLNQDYLVEEVGENKPGAVGAGSPEKTAEEIGASIIADAEAKAAEILEKAQEKAGKVKGAKAAPVEETVNNQEGGQ
jgi:hypothetical protein